MKLYGVSMSPFAERCVIVLDAKGALDTVPMSMPKGGLGEGMLPFHPLGKIPALELDSGETLIEGQAIAEYLDAVLDGPDMLPADPLARARVSAICHFYDSEILRGFGPILQALIWQRKDEEAIKLAVSTTIPKALDALEVMVGDAGYAVGDGFTLADAALIPMLFQLRAFVAHFGLSDVGDRPKLMKWQKTMMASDLGQRSGARAQAVLDKMMARQAKG